MFKKIAVPVDLQHLDALEKSLTAAANIAKMNDAEVCYLSVGATFKSQGHDPATFEARLKEFADQQAAKHGLRASSHAIMSVDPVAELDAGLVKEIEASGCDLVVMGSHKPGMANYFFASNGGYVANHAQISVMLVRG